MANFIGTPQNDDYPGTTGIDTSGTDDFHMEQGGNDRVNGGGAGDVFWFGAAFNAKDRIDGGDGSDTLVVDGHYASPIFLKDNTIKNVEGIDLLGAHSYYLHFRDGNVGANQTMTVVCALDVGFSATIDFNEETNGNYIVFGSEGDDRVYGGAGDDVIFGGAGFDRVYAGLGTDTIQGNLIHFIGDGALDKSDKADGGFDGGVGAVILSGDYSAGLKMGPDTLANINVIELGAGFSYSLKIGKLTDMPHVNVNGVTLGASDVLNFSGAGASFGVTVAGGAGNDILMGGNKQNIFDGNLGADVIKGRPGPPGAPADEELYRYFTVEDSTSAEHDTLVNFDTRDSLIGIFTPGFDGVGAIEESVVGGRLSMNVFDANLENAIGADELGATNAVLFLPDRGGLRDKIFLIVDLNDTGGYQPGEDLVLRLDNPVFTGFTVDTFVGF